MSRICITLSAILTLGLCSCASMSPLSNTAMWMNEPDACDPFLEGSDVETVESKPALEQDIEHPPPLIRTVSHSETSSTEADSKNSNRLTTADRSTVKSNVGVTRLAETVEPSATSFQPAEPRTDIQPVGCVSCPPGYGSAGYCAPNGYPPYHAAPGLGLPYVEQAWPDEYICDGGDRAYPVRYDEFGQIILDTEDTVAIWRDHNGKRYVDPTNRVCVYAPRFAATVNVSQPVAGVSVDEVNVAIKEDILDEVSDRVGTVTHRQNDALRAVRMRSRASGLDSNLVAALATRRLSPLSHTKLINLHQGIRFLVTGRFDQTEEAYLAKKTLTAATWSLDQYPVITGQVEGAGELLVRFKPMETSVYENPRSPGKLRIVKLADKETAVPGDVVTFTLRFDNLGEREVHDIVIVDNLSPRLEYLEDSETSTLPGDLHIKPNAEGSVELHFELDDPLPGGEGGVITFQAIVR